MQSEPRNARIPVWALSISLAATLEIEFSFSSCRYLDVSVHDVPSITLWIHAIVTELFSAGFPHSDISGSLITSISPKLFAGSRVLLRLLVPRHPPYALNNFSYLFYFLESLKFFARNLFFCKISRFYFRKNMSNI